MSETKADTLRNDLIDFGELHVTTDSGDEYHLHRHDVTVQDDRVFIDSRLGRWAFDLANVESVEYPDSHKE